MIQGVLGYSYVTNGIARVLLCVPSRESEKLAMRYRKFNLQALLDASVKAAGNDEISCVLSFYCNIPWLMSVTGVKLLKCVEGQFNKAFLLTLSNGLEIVARLPNPNAGPAFYTIASEVATRNFVWKAVLSHASPL